MQEHVDLVALPLCADDTIGRSPYSPSVVMGIKRLRRSAKTF